MQHVLEQVVALRYPDIKIKDVWSTYDFDRNYIVRICYEKVDYDIKFSVFRYSQHENAMNVTVQNFLTSLEKLLRKIVRDTGFRIGKSLAFSCKKSRGRWLK